MFMIFVSEATPSTITDLFTQHHLCIVKHNTVGEPNSPTSTSQKPLVHRAASLGAQLTFLGPES